MERDGCHKSSSHETSVSRPVTRGRFTIAIPTFNRAEFLRKSLRAALSQTHHDVEVIVCDNASSDATPTVVKEFESRVIYHRHAANIGAGPNFLSAPPLASGEYFSWLQDDDLIHRDFARHAAAALSTGADVNVYACYAASGPSESTYIWPAVSGPGVPLDWQSGATSFFRPLDIAPIAFFHSLGIPPTMAFRTTALRTAIPTVPSDCELYVERLIPLLAAGSGTIAIEPWLGGLFLNHAEQSHKIMINGSLAESHWIRMAKRLGHLIDGCGDRSWLDTLARHFERMSIQDRLTWLNDAHSSGLDWEAAHPVAYRARQCLIESLPSEARSELAKRRYGAKALIRDIAPPVLLRTAVAICNSLGLTRLR